MKAKTIIALVVVLALVLTASIVLAQRGKGPAARPGTAGIGPGVGCVCPGCPMGAGLAKGVGLTQDQIEAVKQIQADCAAACKAGREDIQAMAKQMAGLWAADEPDAAAIKALAADIDAVRASMRNTCIDNTLKIRALLTPEQKQKLRDAIAKCSSVCGAQCAGMGCGMMMGCGAGPGACGIGPGACGVGPKGMMGAGCGMGAGRGPMGQGCPMAK